MSAVQLKLYIAGKSRRTELAIANLRSALDKELNGDYDIVVNDIFQNPEIAEEQAILATPTLVKELPLPTRRIIGDFSNVKKVIEALDLQPRPLKGGRNYDE